MLDLGKITGTASITKSVSESAESSVEVVMRALICSATSPVIRCLAMSLSSSDSITAAYQSICLGLFMSLEDATHELERVVYRRLGAIDDCYRDPRDFCSDQGYSKTLEVNQIYISPPHTPSPMHWEGENTICPAPMTPSRLTLCPAEGDAEMENKRAV